MKALGPPESHYLSAAIGWLELGSLTEAEAELAQIQSPQNEHPDVLEVRWLLCARREQWEDGLQVAKALLEKAPKRVSGWLHQAYALRRIPGGSVQKAWDVLLPAAERFPKEPLVAYNLSCYACQMQQLDDARRWFKRALSVGDEEYIRRAALADKDQEPLWPEIRQEQLG